MEIAISLGYPAQHMEDGIHQKGGDRHGRIKHKSDIGSHSPAVVATIDIKQRNDDEIGIKKSKDA